MNKNLLIIFVRNPIPGKVKTRLAKDIGDEQACKIYQEMLSHIKSITINLGCSIHIYYSDFINKNDIWNDEVYDKHLQVEGDLGVKLSCSFEDGFDNGFEKVVAIGSDCFDLTEDIINKSFDVLDDKDYVVGPAIDGGYYLLGMKCLSEELFINKQWSTPTVFFDTVSDIENQDKTYSLLPRLSDIDTVEDLDRINYKY